MNALPLLAQVAVYISVALVLVFAIWKILTRYRFWKNFDIAQAERDFRELQKEIDDLMSDKTLHYSAKEANDHLRRVQHRRDALLHQMVQYRRKNRVQINTAPAE